MSSLAPAQFERLRSIKALRDALATADLPALEARRALDAGAHRLLGNRDDRRRAIAARKELPNRMHQRQRRCARSKGEQHRDACALGKARDHVQRVIGLVMDDAVHRDDMIEIALLRRQHVADSEFDPSQQIARQVLTRMRDQRRRQVHGIDFSAPARGLDRQQAGATAGIEQALVAEVGRQPVEQRRAHAIAAGAHSGADAAHRRI